MVQRLTLRKKRKFQNVRGKRRRMTYRKMVHKQTLGKKRKSQNVRGTRRIMTYKKTGRYNSEGGVDAQGDVQPKVVIDPHSIEEEYILTIPYYIGRYLRGVDGRTRLEQNTVYSLPYNYYDPKTRRRIIIYKRNLLKKIIDFNEYLHANMIDPRKKDYYTRYRQKLEKDDATYNSKDAGIFYFKITPPREDELQEDASVDQAKQEQQQLLTTKEEFGIEGTDEEIDARPLPSLDTEPSPVSVTNSLRRWWGGKRIRRRQQGLKQNKLQTIKKYYKNK